MPIDGLADALKDAKAANKGKGVDLLAFDACNMAAIEVVYELRDAVPYLVASQSMVPFDGLLPRLRRVVRQASGELGKQVQLKLEGTQGELDRNVLERMTAPLEHMLRNSVAHGLELPAQRKQAGKPEEAVAAYDALAKEGSVDPLFKDFADGFMLTLLDSIVQVSRYAAGVAPVDASIRPTPF